MPFVNFFSILAISILVMILLLLLVRRYSYAKKISLTNDIVGFYVTLVGTLYGVLIGFVVLVVWTRFDQAEILVENEASALANIYGLVGQLSDPEKTQVRASLQRYADFVIKEEWAIMEAGKGQSKQASDELFATWKLMGEYSPKNLREQVLMSEGFDQISELYKTRRLRLLANDKEIPSLFWLVLIVGGVLTIGSTAFFNVERFGFHALKMSILTLLVCLVLYAIWELDKPFQRNIHISSHPFSHSK